MKRAFVVGDVHGAALEALVVGVRRVRGGGNGVGVRGGFGGLLRGCGELRGEVASGRRVQRACAGSGRAWSIALVVVAEDRGEREATGVDTPARGPMRPRAGNPRPAVMTRGEERPARIVFIFNKTEGDGRPAAARAGGGRAPRRPARGRRDRPHDAAKRLSSVSASHHGPTGCALRSAYT